MSTIATLPGLGSTEDLDGRPAWANPEFIQTADSDYASCDIVKGDYSDWLRASDFGFVVPTGVVIDGVVVEIHRAASLVDSVCDTSLRLVNASGVNEGNEKASSIWYPLTTPSTMSYGSPSDKWGVALTPEIVNNSNFGIRLASRNDDFENAHAAMVYWVKITVYYTVGTWLPGWSNRVQLETDPDDIDADLNNFPILLHLSASCGRNSKDLSYVFNHLVSDANRKKIAVTTDDGSSQCYVEIEKWDTVNKQAWLWVKAPVVRNLFNTLFILYFDVTHADNTTYVGDPNSTPAGLVWDSNFKAVYHMADGASTSAIYDSTANNKDGTKKAAGNPAVTTDGKIGNAQDFEYTTLASYITLAVLGAWHTTDTEMTIEHWYKGESDTGLNQALFCLQNDGDIYTAIQTGTKKAFLSLYEATSGWKTLVATTVLTLDGSTWYHIVGTWKKNDYMRVYLNGASDATPSALHNEQLIDAGINVRIGSYSDGGYNCDGLLDEVRISNVVRSAAWIKATYETTRDHLLNWGDEEVMLPYRHYYQSILAH